MARIGVEDHHLGWRAAGDEQAVIGLVERHGEVGLEGQLPSGDRAGLAVDDGDLLEVRQIHVDVWAVGFQLEGFRVGSELVFFVEALVGDGVDHGDSGGFVVSVADVNALLGGVVAEVVDVSAEVDRGDGVEGGSVVDVELAFGAGDEELIGLGGIGDALRGGNSGDGVDDALGAEIDDFFCIVPQGGDEQAVPGIEGEMVNAAFDVIQRDGAGQGERGGCRSRNLLSRSLCCG